MTQRKFVASIAWQTGPPSANLTGVTWTFSGAGVEPETATGLTPTTICRLPGKVTAKVTLTFEAADPVERTYTAYVIGGPFNVNNSSSARSRDTQIIDNQTLEEMPFWLDYFPGYESAQNFLTCKPMLGNQPAGTSFRWEVSGPAYSTNTTNNTIEVRGMGPSSSLGDVRVILYYELEIQDNGLIYKLKAEDCTEKYRSVPRATPVENVNARRATSHQPLTVVNEPRHQETIIKVNTSPFSHLVYFGMELRSQLDSPISGLIVQERFPPSGPPTTFFDSTIKFALQWNGTEDTVWTSGVRGRWVPRAGQRTNGLFTDMIGFYGWPGPARPDSNSVPVYLATHHFYALSAETSGTSGIHLQQYTIKMFTDFKRHITR